MSKKNIEKYIPKAMEVLDENLENGTFPKEYNGYISSFGASVIQSGIKPTLALFENQNSTDRYKIIEFIFEVLKRYENINTNETSLLRYFLNSQNQDILKIKIMDISIALKLSLRTFKKGD